MYNVNKHMPVSDAIISTNENHSQPQTNAVPAIRLKTNFGSLSLPPSNPSHDAKNILKISRFPLPMPQQ
jgi:hypothetical protein